MKRCSHPFGMQDTRSFHRIAFAGSEDEMHKRHLGSTKLGKKMTTLDWELHSRPIWCPRIIIGPTGSRSRLRHSLPCTLVLNFWSRRFWCNESDVRGRNGWRGMSFSRGQCNGLRREIFGRLRRLGWHERLEIKTFRGVCVTLLEFVLWHSPIHDLHAVTRDERSVDLLNTSIIRQLMTPGTGQRRDWLVESDGLHVRADGFGTRETEVSDGW